MSSINIPLRERKEDIILLANHFMKSLPVKLRLSNSALKGIIDYSWPGNAELKNVLEQASILNEDGIIKPQHMPVLAEKVFRRWRVLMTERCILMKN